MHWQLVDFYNTILVSEYIYNGVIPRGDIQAIEY